MKLSRTVRGRAVVVDHRAGHAGLELVAQRLRERVLAAATLEDGVGHLGPAARIVRELAQGGRAGFRFHEEAARDAQLLGVEGCEGLATTIHVIVFEGLGAELLALRAPAQLRRGIHADLPAGRRATHAEVAHRVLDGGENRQARLRDR
jgi:hypothetical protein